MAKRITKAKRRFLLAVVRGEVCETCQGAPAMFGRHARHVQCGPCVVKRVDARKAPVLTWR